MARSLTVLILAAAIATLAPAAASAAPCASGTTNWTGATSSDFGTDTNWSNGGPSAACDAVISVATNTPVQLSGGPFTVDDLTVSANRQLDIKPNSTLNTTTTANAGTIRLGLPGEPLSATLSASSAAANALANSGTILSTGSGGVSSVNFLKGNVTNTGTLQVDQQLWWNSDTATPDTFTNKGTVGISAACSQPGGACFYANETATNFFNDVGGNITNNGGSTFFLVESGFTQGAGNTSVGNPQSAVVMRGNLAMTGASSTAEISGMGPSQGINASGTVGPGQTVKIPGGTLAVPSGTLINQGTIRTTGSASSITGNITTTGSGLLDIAVQTSHSGGTLDATGGNILAGAQLNLSATLMNHGGQITGPGPIIGNVDNVSGIVNPKNGIGSMTITGNYTQGAGGTLAIEAQGAAGPQHDLLLVGGNPNLDGVLRIVPEAGYFTPAEGDALKVLDYSGTRTGTFSSSLADPSFTSGNAVNAGYDDSDTSVFAFIGLPTGSPKGPGALFNSPLYRAILESLEPNGSFRFSKKPVVFPGGKLGLEVDTGGSCRLTAVERATASAQSSATASKKGKKKKGLVKKVTVYASGSGTHVIPLNLTAKGKKLLKKRGKGKGKKGKASASTAQALKDPLVITCAPIVYPVASFTDGTQVTGIGQAPKGSPPAGQPSIPAGPPTVVKTGGPVVTQKPIVPLPVLPPDPPPPAKKTFKATVDNDATVGASVQFASDGKAVTAFSASFRVVCGFPFPESAPLETISFKSIPAVSVLGGGSGVIQGSFTLAQQEGSSLPPTWITVSIQGDNSNGYSVRVYERRAGCEGGTIFNARRVP